MFIVVTGTILGGDGAFVCGVLIFVWVSINSGGGGSGGGGGVVVVITMGAYIHGVLILCGCLLFRFYSITNGSFHVKSMQKNPYPH